MPPRILQGLVAVLVFGGALVFGEPEAVCRIGAWRDGISVSAPDDPGMTVYLWLYEWNVFEAFKMARLSDGPKHLKIEVMDEGRTARVEAEGIVLTAAAESDGARLELRVKNNSYRTWPREAGIVPCLSPGDPHELVAPINASMLDAEQTRTWFEGPSGSELLVGRDLHFRRGLFEAVNMLVPGGTRGLFPKWGVSPRFSVSGALFRGSSDDQWVAGIGWEDFTFVQGHNRWKCMHVCVKVGPLGPWEERTHHGKLFLFRGRPEQGFAKWRDSRATSRDGKTEKNEGMRQGSGR